MKFYKSLLIIGASSLVLCSCSKNTDEYNKSTVINESEVNEIIDDSNEAIEKNNYQIEYDETSSNVNIDDKDEMVLKIIKDKKDELNKTTDLNKYKEKAIDLFITITDFIFYDGKIYNIEYDELKEETKKTILSDLAEIDSIISSKYPNYKEDFKAKYDKATNWTSDKYNNMIDNVKSSLSDESLNNIEEFKESLKETGGDLTNTAGSIYNDQKIKVKSWYEKFKNNH
ncbi:MAG: hypothetical protein IJ715_03180 [Bacilli bacterium]|nr:hypothetical protein [Bacilli bacterium]